MFIIKDWAGNTMNWGEFNDFEDASCELDARVNSQLLDCGIDYDKTYKSGLEGDYPALETLLDKIISDFRGEYEIEEVIRNEHI